MFKKSPAIAALVCGAMLFGAQATHARVSLSQEEIAKRVNIAGAQRMLSQRMVAEACYIAIGVDVDESKQQLLADVNRFSAVLEDLVKGNPEQSLSPEPLSSIVFKLKSINTDWDVQKPNLIQAGAYGALNVGQLSVLDTASLNLLKKMDATVKRMTKAYSDGVKAVSSSPIVEKNRLAHTIDVAGKQRMLSQKASKEFCLVIAGVDAAGNGQKLMATVSEFEAAQADLINGNANADIMPPVTAEVSEQLKTVQTLWSDLQGIMRAAAAGGQVSDADRLKLQNGLENVLKAANAAVGMYESSVAVSAQR